MDMIKIGRHHINTARLVNVISPARKQHDDRTRPNQGICENAVVVVLAGTDDLVLFDDEAEAMREWLSSQAAPKSPVVTKTTTTQTK